MTSLLSFYCCHFCYKYTCTGSHTNRTFVSEKAVLQYKYLDDKENTVDFYHTGVPSAYQGKGIAAELVKVIIPFSTLFTSLVLRSLFNGIF